MVDTGLLSIIRQTLIQRLNPRRIILFGSRARGDARPDSDIDLFVEMETVRTPPERSVEVSALFGLRPWSLDVVVYTPDEVRSLRGKRGTLLSVVEAEGQVLYERA